jgi:hypothetical protein
MNGKKFKGGYTVNIPKKYKPMLRDIYKDCDGWWSCLNEGYICDDTQCQTIHEDTQAQFMQCLRTCRKLKIGE